MRLYSALFLQFDGLDSVDALGQSYNVHVVNLVVIIIVLRIRITVTITMMMLAGLEAVIIMVMQGPQLKHGVLAFILGITCHPHESISVYFTHGDTSDSG